MYISRTLDKIYKFIVIILVQDVRKRKQVRTEMINTVVEFVVQIHRGVGNPSMIKIFEINKNELCIELAVMREIVVAMGQRYPSMFEDTGDKGI